MNRSGTAGPPVGRLERALLRLLFAGGRLTSRTEVLRGAVSGVLAAGAVLPVLHP